MKSKEIGIRARIDCTDRDGHRLAMRMIEIRMHDRMHLKFKEAQIAAYADFKREFGGPSGNDCYVFTNYV